MLEIIKGPYLQSPKVDGMTIMWETSMPASSCVEVLLAERIHSGHQGNYRKPDQVLSTIQHEDFMTIHRVTVEGLAPEQLYFYRISSRDTDSEVMSDTYPLKTAVPPGGAFSFAVTSETGGYSGFDTTGGSINRRIFQQMQRYRPDLALFIGDIVNDGREYEDWETYFFGPGRDLLTNTPLYSCLGNHECNGEWYYKYFDFPSPRNYYSFDYGDVHFTCLDSTDFIPDDTYPYANGGIAPGNAQFDFLVQDLASSTAKWKIVFFHYPPYVSGGYQVEDLRQLSPLFEANGVDLVLTSHTIVYERSHPLYQGQIDEARGITYIVAGGAGAMPSWLLPKREWHTSQSVAVPHFVQVVVTPSRLELRAIDDEGRLFDQFILKKDQASQRTYF
ncbi:metallophosphoesterase family protein [Paenibacillus terrigena]|uniref:metallophosphoesterase family protein n=1 Tax=Paenibacillus terrigena TaxID=369333 RepID=UPI0028D8623B|nr:metallophosphoesterase family protein [Paenibacillus terrigena]